MVGKNGRIYENKSLKYMLIFKLILCKTKKNKIFNKITSIEF